MLRKGSLPVLVNYSKLSQGQRISKFAIVDVLYRNNYFNDIYVMTTVYRVTHPAEFP